MWAVMEQKKETDGLQAPCGYVVIYVDDFLAAGPRGLVDSIIKRINEEWVCSLPEWIHHEGWTKFCGMELRWNGDGDLHVAQPSYIAELIKRHNVECARPVPFSKPEIPENPQMTPEAIRAAQGLVGELLRLSVRTRPDVSFGVQHVTRCSQEVVKVGMEMMAYLYGTKELGLMYGGCKGDRGPDGGLPFARSMRRLEMYADISFARLGEKSHQGVLGFYGGALVQWESSRQPFATLSTAGSRTGGLHRGHDHG